jgi:hypothetical protein
MQKLSVNGVLFQMPKWESVFFLIPSSKTVGNSKSRTTLANYDNYEIDTIPETRE